MSDASNGSGGVESADGTESDATDADVAESDVTETAEGNDPRPFVRRGSDVEYDSVGAADGLRKGVLIDESDGAPHFAIRRFELEAGATVPRHINAVEHEQYVLDGEYVVGLGEEEHVVSTGDALLIPAGVEHWYRNDGSEPAAFLCAVPNGDDEIRIVE